MSGHEEANFRIRGDSPKMHKTKNSDLEPTQRTRKEKGDKYFPTIGNSDGYCKLKRCLRVAATGTQSKIAMRGTIDMQDQQRQDSSGCKLWAPPGRLCFGLFYSVVQGKEQVCYPCHQDTERVTLRKHCPVPWKGICPQAPMSSVQC